VVLRLAIALSLGLLVGFQRERTESTLAGVRTFALVTLLGAVTALLSETLGGWIVAAGLIGVTTMVVVGNLTKLSAGDSDPGITTEIAALLMFALGAFLMLGPLAIGIALGGVAAVLLHEKARLRGLATRLGDEDVKTIMRFVLITLVILPVLPNETYGPFEVLNPREIWLMVVLIVAIGLVGYLLYKGLGERVGTVLSGLLGGTVSSTATTVSYARQSRTGAWSAGTATIVILLATAVVFARVLIEIGVVAPASFRTAFPPLAILFVVFLALSAVAWRLGRSGSPTPPDLENPTELKSALVFGAMYAAVLLAVAAARTWFGTQGIYAIAALSGLTDLDAITLSTARLTATGSVTPETLWRVTVIAMLSNLAFKLGIVRALGGPSLFRRVAPFYAIGFVVAAALLLLWPTAGL
jgi:uncharacterized membrane protein (DUF4010 family)